MSGVSQAPRSDQIAELTRGIQSPLEPLHDLHLKIIAEMLAQAWDDLLHSQKMTLTTGSEAEINALMETRLIALIDENVLLSSLVLIVARGKEIVSFDGRHLEKQPDLSIYLTKRNCNFPLAVECKLIDSSSGKRVSLYCKNGLVRFVLGEYAWASREAFMLAYVRDNSSINTSLTPLLSENQTAGPDPFCTEKTPVPAKHPTLDLAWSRHSRSFNYVGGSPNNSPGPITLWHLWVSASA